ncbi:MAG: ZIP family metal transporter [Acidobacteriota bacterium]|jgi:zinc transporter ZupT
MSPVLLVFIYGLITAATTALGALPFAFVKRISNRTVAYANSIAAGLMLGACFQLVVEGSGYGHVQTGAGALLGVGFILLAQRFLAERDVEIEEVQSADARRMILIVVVMTVHSMAEGIAVGAAFGGGRDLAILITAAIAVHNIPEGLAISAVLRPRGTSILKCAWWSFFSSIPQPLLAVPAFLFVEAIQPALPYGLGFAAGAMIFMVLVELLPEAYEEGRRPAVGLLVSSSLVAMIVVQQYL